MPITVQDFNYPSLIGLNSVESDLWNCPADWCCSYRTRLCSCSWSCWLSSRFARWWFLCLPWLDECLYLRLSSSCHVFSCDRQVQKAPTESFSPKRVGLQSALVAQTFSLSLAETWDRCTYKSASNLDIQLSRYIDHQKRFMRRPKHNRWV